MLASFVALALTGGMAAEASSSIARNSLTVHLIRRCQTTANCLSPGIVRRMKDETARIWSSLDVRIVWIDPADSGSAVPASVDLRVMLEESADPGPAWDAKGGLVLAAVHQPDVPCGPGLARVWVTRARRHVASIRFLDFPPATLPDSLADLFLARSLGRALAHEIGHYLLGSARHTSYGLMRARFTPQELLEPPTQVRYGLNSRDRLALDACRPDRAELP